MYRGLAYLRVEKVQSPSNRCRMRIRARAGLTLISALCPFSCVRLIRDSTSRRNKASWLASCIMLEKLKFIRRGARTLLEQPKRDARARGSAARQRSSRRLRELTQESRVRIGGRMETGATTGTSRNFYKLPYPKPTHSVNPRRKLKNSKPPYPPMQGAMSGRGT